MENRGTAVIKAQPPTLVLTEEAIITIQHNIQMAEKLVMSVLEKEVDYGIHPGTSSYALRDPGASKIINSFNCYPDHKILHSEETEDLTSYLVQANLISRQTGAIVAPGVGACSTMETKYAVRWVENPEDYGYKREELTRRRKGKFRIPNPEISDLGNTILKMAAKRAEIDACQNLPGVGSALKKLFGAPAGRKQPDWDGFYRRLAQLGITKEQAQEKLGVKSFKDWIGGGKTLEDAITVLSQGLAQPIKRQESTADIPEAEQPKEEEPEAKAPVSESTPEGFGIDMDWVNETLKELKWSRETTNSFLAKYKVSTEGTLGEVIARLNREQAEDFVKALQAKLALKQGGLLTP